MKPQLSAPLGARYGGISVVDHTHCKSPPTPVSLSYGYFLLPWRFSHCRWPDSIIPAALSSLLISIDPSRSKSLGSALSSSKQALNSAYSVTSHPISLLFGPWLPHFLLSSYLLSALISVSPPFILSRSQTTSALIQINFKTHLFPLFWLSICTKPACSWMFSKTLSKVDKFENSRLMLHCRKRMSFLSCDISFADKAKALSLASNVMRPCFCDL